MNVSDMAYLVQTKATRAPDITQPIYQLNMLHLKAVSISANQRSRSRMGREYCNLAVAVGRDSADWAVEEFLTIVVRL